MKNKIFLLLSLCLLVYSCAKVKPPYLDLDQTEITFSHTGGSQAISFKTNYNWTITSSESWCTVSPTSGFESSIGTTATTVTAIANNTFEDRSCTVTISANQVGLYKHINVTQSAKTGLEVTQNNYNLSNSSSTINVEVKANVEFDITISGEWITRNTTKALSSTMLFFDIAKNETYGNREGTITIKQKNGELVSVITVSQSQKDAIILSNKNVNLSSDGHALNVELSTNVEFDVIIPEVAKSWVSYTPTKALRTETLILDIAENLDEVSRTTEVYVKNKATTLQDTLTITQDEKNPLLFNVKNMGTLGTILNQIQKDTITKMILRGEINKADFDVIRKMRNLRYLDLKDVKCENNKIPARAFNDYDGGTELNTIIFPTSIVTIGEAAFSFCSTIIGSLDLPVGLLNIESNAFSDCSGFSGPLTLPSTVTAIGSGAFSNCTGFSGSLTIPSGLNIIEDRIWYNCGGISGTLTFPDGLTTIGEAAFARCNGITGPLNLPAGLTSIGRWAFLDCSGFSGSLTFPAGLTTIGSEAFHSCRGFSGSLNFPDALISIGGGAFTYCSGFSGSLTLPPKLTIIESQVFMNCPGFNGSLTLPSGILSIEKEAFRSCVNISGTIMFPATLTSVKERAFDNCDNLDVFQFPHTTPLQYQPNMLPSGATVKVPSSAVATYQSTDGWKNFNIVGY